MSFRLLVIWDRPFRLQYENLPSVARNSSNLRNFSGLG
jgi:hypothetical protein